MLRSAQYSTINCWFRSMIVLFHSSSGHSYRPLRAFPSHGSCSHCTSVASRASSTTVCGWERQAPLTGREPWPLGLAQRLKNDAVPTELLWKLQVSALLQLDLRRHICYDLANLCHPTGGLFTCVCSEGLPGCKAGCPYTVIRGLRLAVTLPPRRRIRLSPISGHIAPTSLLLVRSVS